MPNGTRIQTLASTFRYYNSHKLSTPHWHILDNIAQSIIEI